MSEDVATAALLAGVGIGFAAAGIFDETNPLHWALGTPLAFGGAILGFLLAGVLLRRDPAWRAWGTATVLASLLTVVLIGLLFYVFSSYTFTPGDPSPNGQLGGLTEQIVIVEILAWHAATGFAQISATARPPCREARAAHPGHGVGRAGSETDVFMPHGRSV